MNAQSIESLVLSTLNDFGGFALVVLTAVISVSVAYLAFRFGWSKIKGSMGIDYYEGYTSSMMKRDNARAFGTKRKQ